MEQTINVEYINPFLAASVTVTKQIANIEAKIGKPSIKAASFSQESLLIIMGVTGEMRGQVILNFPLPTAKNIAGRMCSMTFDEMNELAESAVCELCNMILGNTATLYSLKNIAIDITPPTICRGSDIMFTQNYSVNIAIPVNYGDGFGFEVNVALAKEDKK